MVFEGALEAARGALVRRGGEMVGEVVFDTAAKQMLAADAAAPAFSTGATALIAITSAAVGGLAGWALHDIFIHSRKGRRR